MDITPLVPRGRQIVESYGEGGFRISGQRHAGSVLIFPDRTLAWSVAAMDDLTIETLSPIVEAAAQLEILVLGCGAEFQLVSQSLRSDLRAHGVVLDAMDTGAACRTYNVLIMEARAVAAALIAVE